MKNLFFAMTLLVSTTAMAQMKFNALGVGFDYNGGYNMTHSGVYAALEEATNFTDGKEGVIGVNRVGLVYRFGFKPSSKDFFRFETDILQGSDYMSYDDYESKTWQSGDTSFRQSNGYYFYNTSAYVGMRLRARISTPMEKRFHYNFAVSVGASYFYNSQTDGSRSESISISTDTFFDFRELYSDELSQSILEPYTSYSIMQQAGVGFRLGKDEKSFPLNRTYLEWNILVSSNFTTINDVMAPHRTWGTSLSLVYEFR